jgi:hypothetical protein
MKLSESQLRKLVREMSDDFYDAGDRLPDYLEFIGLDMEDGLDMVFSTLSGHGPVDALGEIQVQLKRRLSRDEVRMLIDLFIKDGWFQ